MKYPFLDTPSNRKLESLISQCVEPDRLVSRDMGRFIFHVLPNSSIREIPQIEGWDIAIQYVDAHVGVIDKETGRFGMAKLYDSEANAAHYRPSSMLSVDSLVQTLNEGTLKDIYTQFPYLVNLDRDDDALTYHDHFQELTVKKNPSRQAYLNHIDWLMENGHKKAGSVDAPKVIESLMAERVRNWKGAKNQEGQPAGGDRLLTRYSSYERMPELLANNFKAESVIRIEDYRRDDEYRESMKDIKTSLDPESLRYRNIGIMLDLSLDEYYSGRDSLHESMRDSYNESCQLFKENFLGDYRNTLTDRYMARRDKMTAQDVEVVIDRIMHYLNKDVTIAKNLFSDTPSAVRNKLQVLDFFEGDEQAFSAFISDDKIKEGIEEGKPMKKTLEHLPLLNMSKRTVNAYMKNFKSYLAFEGKPVKLLTEKGESEITQLSLKTSLSLGKSLHNAVALMTTMPEKHLIDEDRRADKMAEVLVSFPGLIETLSHRFVEAREGRGDIQNVTSWIPRELESMEKRPQTVRDATSIFTDSYYGTVIRHLNQHMIDTENHHKHSNSRLRGDALMKSLAETGEYRNTLSFDDKIHKDVHQLFKSGKPDSDIEWERTIEEDFHKNGYCISPITSNTDLSQEGAELNHCVGSYLRKVLANESYIFSVTHEGKRVSTLEIGESLTGEMEIVQHFANGNTTPPEGALDVAHDFLEAINNEEINFDTSPCGSELMDQIFDEDEMSVEREEVEFGLRFSDRDFVLETINRMNDILPSFDVWTSLEKEDIPASTIESLREDFKKAYGETAELTK